MKVRELVALLSQAEPEDEVILDAKSGCLIIIQVKLRGGMHPAMDDDDALTRFTEQDKEFLRSMHIPL